MNIAALPASPNVLRPGLMRFAVVLAIALAGLAGCGTSHSVTAFPNGITVHTFRRDYSNAHLISRGEAFFMVDAGLEANAPALAEDLQREGFEPARLRAIILTHGHADHAGGAAYFRQRYGTRIVVGAQDAALLAAGANDPLCPTSEQARDRVATDQTARFTPFAANVTIDTEVALEDIVSMPGTIIPLPGHTPGSLVVTIPGAAFVGDLLRGAIVGTSAEVHFYMCDLDDNRQDVRTLLDRLSASETQFFVGHFGPVSRADVEERFR